MSPCSEICTSLVGLRAQQVFTSSLASVERVRAEASEREAQLQRQMKEQAEQMARDKERSYREHEQQLRDRFAEDQRRAAAQYETLLQQKLQVTAPSPSFLLLTFCFFLNASSTLAEGLKVG